MDLLYSRYSNPLEFMNMYINQGRFGEFVGNIIDMDHKRKQEEAEKENEQKMWMMYVHSMSGKSFNDWKHDVLHQSQKAQNMSASNSLSMTDDDVEKQIDSARNILKGLKI